MNSKVALVTGASRGIGKACATHLAAAGFDVAITARTASEGEPREHSSTVARSDTRPLPGSLETTAGLIEGLGRRCLQLPADLLDPYSVGAAVGTLLERWGHVDVVVNNARYIGPGHMDRFLDTPLELLAKHLDANVFAPLAILKLVVPKMAELGSGTIVNITSAAAYGDPTQPAGSGGWGMGYGVSKGAFHRIAGFLAVELADLGIQCFNVQPGVILTERIAMDMKEFGYGEVGEPTDVVGAVVAWLATQPEAKALNGTNIEAQFFCAEHELLPGWSGPHANPSPIRYDLSGANLQAFEAALESSTDA